MSRAGHLGSAQPVSALGLGTIAGLGLQVIALMYLTVSPLALILFGWQYDDTGSGAIEKFHPATLLLILVFLWVLAGRGNPLSAVIEMAHTHGLLVVYLSGIAFMAVYAARVVQVPFTIFLETFGPPLLLLILLEDARDDLLRRLALLVHLAFLVNSVIAIGEASLDFRLTPLTLNGEVVEDEMRSTALMGHPLANAVLTGSYLLTLALGGGRDLPAILRPLLFLVGAAGMAVFGGRAATALLIAFLILYGLRRALAIARGARFDANGVLVGLVVLPVVAVIGLVLHEVGFFDTFLNRVTDDTGSADTRIVMFELFRHQNWHDLVFAPDPGLVATWARLYGTDFGIESFLVQYLLTYGIIATMVFLPALAAFCIEVARAVRPGGGAVLAYFFIVALTSVSLSAKSPVFTIFVLMLLTLLRQTPAADRFTTPAEPLRLRPRRRVATGPAPV
ncbi:MAG: VpsF family polysaccharide biosynthesis protein [Hyphomicrobium sp.]